MSGALIAEVTPMMGQDMGCPPAELHYLLRELPESLKHLGVGRYRAGKNELQKVCIWTMGLWSSQVCMKDSDMSQVLQCGIASNSWPELGCSIMLSPREPGPVTNTHSQAQYRTMTCISIYLADRDGSIA